MAWTSTDGRSWTHATTLPVDALSSPTGSAPLVAAGPDGLVVATSGLAAHFATSSDGSHWVLSPRNAFPADFALDDLEGTSTGYVAIGAWMKRRLGRSGGAVVGRRPPLAEDADPPADLGVGLRERRPSRMR